MLNAGVVMNNIFKDNARKYFESGFSVIPLKPKDKIPFFKKWSSYCITAPTEDEFSSWEDKFYNANIGLCLGKASKIVAFDFDFTVQNSDVIESFVLGHLPLMPVKKKGKKGWTAFFKYSGQKNHSCIVKINKKFVTVFDFLSDGKQTVIPPSIHPSGDEFRWVTQHDLLSCDFLPEISENEILELSEFIKENYEKLHELNDKNIISSIPRHNQIFKQICKLSTKLKTKEELYNSIYEFDVYRHKIKAEGWQDKETPYFLDKKYFTEKSNGIIAAKKLVDRVLNWQKNINEKQGKNFIIGESPKKILQDVNESVYDQYRQVFDNFYPMSFVCKLTKDVICYKNNKKKYIMNEEKLIKSECLVRGLKKNDVPEYFERWINELPVKYDFYIPEWDGFDHIAHILSFIRVKNIPHDCFVDLVKSWFAGVFNRLDDCNFQNRMLLLEGQQGVGKDTFIYNLFGAFKSYFNNIEISQNEKDSFENMMRSIVINISEFDRTSKVSSSQIKNMITTPNTLYRKPYARTASVVNFHCSFVSSCNLSDVLKDETGNRRYFFFNIEEIDWNYPKNMSEQILAQAKFLYISGYKSKKESLDAMSKYLDVMTPEKIDDIILDLYNERMSRLASATHKFEFEYHEISELILSIKRESDVRSLKYILSLLKRSGLSFKDNGVLKYVFKFKSFRPKIDTFISKNH